MHWGVNHTYALGRTIYDTMHRGVKCKQYQCLKSIPPQCLRFIKTPRDHAFHKTTPSRAKKIAVRVLLFL